MSESNASAKELGSWLLRPETVAVGLVLLLFLPFVNKAIHIDDHYFLDMADFFGWNPLQAIPQSFKYVGRADKNLLPYELTHPLLIPYLLKVLKHLFGTNEIPLHLAFLFFPWLTLRSLAKLDEALPGGKSESRWLLLVLFGALPAFVVNGQNLMCDVPTLAFFLAGTAAVAQSVYRQGAGTLWQAAFWLTCAIFTSYQYLAYLPVLAGFVLFSGAIRQQVRKVAVVVLVPILLLLVWLILVYAQYGIFPLLKSKALNSISGAVGMGLQPWIMWQKLVYLFSMTGASLLFVLPFRFRDQSQASRLRSVIVVVALASIFCLLPLEETGDWGRRLALALFSALGVFGLGVAAWEIGCWWRTTATQAMAILCGGWLGMALMVNLIALPFASARYLLIVFPCLILVLLRGCSLPQGSYQRPALILAICALLWGGANAWSDYNYAGIYRDMAGEVKQFQQGLGKGQHIWYIGEWGLRYYFNRAGAKYLLANSLEPRAGDYLIIPEMARLWQPHSALQLRTSIYATREWNSTLPLRLFNRRSGAGFYAHNWGMLPFAFSNEPDEVFTIMQVQ